MPLFFLFFYKPGRDAVHLRASLFGSFCPMCKRTHTHTHTHDNNFFFFFFFLPRSARHAVACVGNLELRESSEQMLPPRARGKGKCKGRFPVGSGPRGSVHRAKPLCASFRGDVSHDTIFREAHRRRPPEGMSSRRRRRPRDHRLRRVPRRRRHRRPLPCPRSAPRDRRRRRSRPNRTT